MSDFDYHDGLKFLVIKMFEYNDNHEVTSRVINKVLYELKEDLGKDHPIYNYLQYYSFYHGKFSEDIYYLNHNLENEKLNISYDEGQNLLKLNDNLLNKIDEKWTITWEKDWNDFHRTWSTIHNKNLPTAKDFFDATEVLKNKIEQNEYDFKTPINIIINHYKYFNELGHPLFLLEYKIIKDFKSFYRSIFQGNDNNSLKSKSNELKNSFENGYKEFNKNSKDKIFNNYKLYFDVYIKNSIKLLENFTNYSYEDQVILATKMKTVLWSIIRKYSEGLRIILDQHDSDYNANLELWKEYFDIQLDELDYDVESYINLINEINNPTEEKKRNIMNDYEIINKDVIMELIITLFKNSENDRIASRTIHKLLYELKIKCQNNEQIQTNLQFYPFYHGTFSEHIFNTIGEMIEYNILYIIENDDDHKVLALNEKDKWDYTPEIQLNNYDDINMKLNEINKMIDISNQREMIKFYKENFSKISSNLFYGSPFYFAIKDNFKPFYNTLLFLYDSELKKEKYSNKKKETFIKELNNFVKEVRSIIFKYEGLLPLDKNFIEFNELYARFVTSTNLFFEFFEKLERKDQLILATKMRTVMWSIWRKMAETSRIIKHDPIYDNRVPLWTKYSKLQINELRRDIQRYNNLIRTKINPQDVRNREISNDIKKIYTGIIYDHLTENDETV